MYYKNSIFKVYLSDIEYTLFEYDIEGELPLYKYITVFKMAHKFLMDLHFNYAAL